jgi:hypothetical protein
MYGGERWLFLDLVGVVGRGRRRRWCNAAEKTNAKPTGHIGSLVTFDTPQRVPIENLAFDTD